MRHSRARAFIVAACVLLSLAGTGYHGGPSYAQENSRLFSETGHSVRGRFLQYWDQHGGLSQQGFPISPEMREVSETDGKSYTVQYFERAVFELHPENQPPYDVLLSLLGVFDYSRKYPGGAPGEVPNTEPGSVLFPETGKRVGGKFLGYWHTHGALAQQGLPISNEFVEKSDLDGKEYRVQYFERAVFELHPENAGTPYEVLLSQLGTFQLRDRYIDPAPIRPLPINQEQRNPMLSTQYLVWNEARIPPGRHDPLPGSGEVWAMDLKTRKQFSVSNGAAGDQWVQDISGSTIVWTDNSRTSSIYEFDVMSKDLATGAEYTVASGPADQVQPVIAGSTVAWTEAAGRTRRLLTKELSGDKVTEIAVSQSVTTTLRNLQISEEYLVWSEVTESGFNGPPVTSFVKARNLKSGEVKTIISFVTGPRLIPPPQYTLADHRLAVSQYASGGFKATITDLDSGEVTPIVTDGFNDSFLMAPGALDGDLLVWGSGYAIWGVNLKDGKAVPLLAARGDQYTAVTAGNWLAWSSLGGPNDGLIGITQLSGALATAEERRKSLPNPAVSPTREIVNYHAVDMVSPDEGWAAGEFGLLAHYKDGKWERMAAQGQSPWLDVAMVAPDNGWIGGTLGLLHYDGRGWSPIRDAAIPDGTIFGIDMLSADEGWAVGSPGILHYKDGKWQVVVAADWTSGGASSLSSIDMVSPDEGWAVGSSSVIWHYSGGKWSRYNEPTDSSLTNVTMVSAEEGWAAGDTGAILHYKDGKWERVPNPDMVTITDFHMLSARDGWAVGGGGAILRYDGDRWTLVDTGIRGIQLKSLDMVSPDEGWAVGRGTGPNDYEGVVLHYRDGKWRVFSRDTR